MPVYSSLQLCFEEKRECKEEENEGWSEREGNDEIHPNLVFIFFLIFSKRADVSTCLVLIKISFIQFVQISLVGTTS